MNTPFADLVPLYSLVVPFLLVLFRVLGLFMFVPAFAHASIPGNVKVLLALAIALCVWNVVPKTAVPLELIPLIRAILGELSVGLVIGILTALVFTGVQLGAHMISQQMGLSLAAVYDPMFDDQSTVIEQLAFWIAFLVFLSIGGHRQLVNVIVQSYARVPMGAGLEAAVMLNVALAGIQTALGISVRVAAPALVVFFLSTIAAGFIGKSMPQINLMSIGMPLNLLLGLLMILVGFSGWAMVSTQAWQMFFSTLTRLFAS